jgi:hypothetical protein
MIAGNGSGLDRGTGSDPHDDRLGRHVDGTGDARQRGGR